MRSFSNRHLEDRTFVVSCQSTLFVIFLSRPLPVQPLLGDLSVASPNLSSVSPTRSTTIFTQRILKEHDESFSTKRPILTNVYLDLGSPSSSSSIGTLRLLGPWRSPSAPMSRGRFVTYTMVFLYLSGLEVLGSSKLIDVKRWQAIFRSSIKSSLEPPNSHGAGVGRAASSSQD